MIIVEIRVCWEKENVRNEYEMIARSLGIGGATCISGDAVEPLGS